MSLVNFITEHRYKSSLFRLNIKNFTVPYGRLKCTNSIPLRCISFSGIALVQKAIRSPGTTGLLLSFCALSTGTKSSHNHRGYPLHCRSYIR